MDAGADVRAEWVFRVLGCRVSQRPAPPLAASRAMVGWQAARGAAIASLKALEAAFRAMDQPESTPAIILLRAIQANLTPEPATPAQVRELAAYINTDDVIQEAEMPNGLGVKVELRRPLLLALAALKREQDTAARP
jgi:hypothetical protein